MCGAVLSPPMGVQGVVLDETQVHLYLYPEKYMDDIKMLLREIVRRFELILSGLRICSSGALL
jgi:hypothetical protein